MSTLINPRKREIPILPNLTILHTTIHQRRIPLLRELLRVRIFEAQTDRLATEPITNVIRVAVVQAHSHAGINDGFKIGEEVRVDEVAGALKFPVDAIVGLGVVDADAERFLHVALVEVFDEKLWGCGVTVGVADLR